MIPTGPQRSKLYTLLKQAVRRKDHLHYGDATQLHQRHPAASKPCQGELHVRPAAYPLKQGTAKLS